MNESKFRSLGKWFVRKEMVWGGRKFKWRKYVNSDNEGRKKSEEGGVKTKRWRQRRWGPKNSAPRVYFTWVAESTLQKKLIIFFILFFFFNFFLKKRDEKKKLFKDFLKTDASISIKKVNDRAKMNWPLWQIK